LHVVFEGEDACCTGEKNRMFVCENDLVQSESVSSAASTGPPILIGILRQKSSLSWQLVDEAPPRTPLRRFGWTKERAMLTRMT
jgi:hypothetical protein